jgi:cell division protease FtsH
MPQSFEDGFGGDKPTNKITASLHRFSDVAGCDEVVEEVEEFVQFLRHPENFKQIGARMPSGLILYGPPGTGKTLVAKAMAGEAGVAFFAVSGSDFVEKYVGVGASRVRDLFKDARRSPGGAVIFIDEVDAIGRRRGDESHPERDQALNALLTEMDGFTHNNRVVVVSATNRLDVIDPALLRPGRFARQVRVGLPDEQGRLEILKIYAEGKPLGPDVSLEDLAKTTAGCSGADLSDMLNEAAIMAAREASDVIMHKHLVEGQLRSLAGPAKRSSMTPEEKEMVAYHEAGHVLAAELCQEHEKAQRASIRPRGQAGGLALYGQQDRALHSARYLHEKIVCALGGRAAEWVKYGVVSSGAANDLQQANGIARQAVGELGFSPKAGQVITTDSGRALPVADATRKIVDEEVERMVSQSYSEAVRLLEENREALDRLAHALLEGEEIDRLEIIQAVRGGGESPQPATREPQGMSPRVKPVEYREEEVESPIQLRPLRKRDRVLAKAEHALRKRRLGRDSSF